MRRSIFAGVALAFAALAGPALGAAGVVPFWGGASDRTSGKTFWPARTRQPVAGSIEAWLKCVTICHTALPAEAGGDDLERSLDL
jgi:hypothetical protein